MKYKHFRDPDNFAYRLEDEADCSICKNKGLWFDAGSFYGVNEIDCICDKCLMSGELQSLSIETNEAFDGDKKDINEIIYKTPALPTWQGREWPFIDGQYCIFEKIASKVDFASKKDFIFSFPESERKDSDLDWLWDVLPEKKITNVKNANYDISVYLFSINGKKFCTWDAS